MTLYRIICLALLSKPGIVSLTVHINPSESFRTKSRTCIISQAQQMYAGENMQSSREADDQQGECLEWILEDQV